MNFFYLAHSKMGLNCLEKLLENNFIPEFVVIHKNYERDKLKDTFFSPIVNLCKRKKILIYEVDKIVKLQDEIKECKLGICVGYMEIIPKTIFESIDYGILNIHCGKLPKYRGRAPISRSIMNGEKYLTVTLHKINAMIDSGDICNESLIKIEDKDDVNSLYNKCSNVIPSLIIDSLIKLKENKLNFKRQLNIPEKANLKISDHERLINWENNARVIFNQIRALTEPYPCAYSKLGEKEYKFLKSEYLLNFASELRKYNSSTLGEILEVTENYILIKCHDSIVKITKLKCEDKTVTNFNNEFKKGDIFS